MNAGRINGSPRAGGNTSIALREMEAVFEQNGVECETVQIGAEPVRGCIACGYCIKTTSAYSTTR